MKNQSIYVPPRYIPLGQSDAEAETVENSEEAVVKRNISAGSTQWTSGICACFDDMQSCMILTFCPGP